MAASTAQPETGQGAYGLTVEGLDAWDLLPSAGAAWPVITVISRDGDGEPAPPSRPEQGSMTVTFQNGGRAVLDRETRTVTATRVPAPSADELLHPMLAHAGAIFGMWLGRHFFHAGTFAVDGGAWALLGDNGAGKSTLLAALALAGCEVLADDALVVENGTAYAGPRCIDLRQEAYRRLRLPGRAARVRSGERYRVVLPPIAAELPLKGLIYLDWGETIAIEPLGARERLERTARECRWLQASDSLTLLDLAALPAYELRRPPSWELLPDVAAAVLETVA